MNFNSILIGQKRPHVDVQRAGSARAVLRLPDCGISLQRAVGIQGLSVLRKGVAAGSHEGLPARRNPLAQEESLSQDTQSCVSCCCDKAARRAGVGFLRADLADCPPRQGGRLNQRPEQSPAVVRTIDDHAPDNRLPAAGQSLAEKVQDQDCVMKNLFVDKQSGKDFDRPAYKRLLRACSESLHARLACIFPAIFCQNSR